MRQIHGAIYIYITLFFIGVSYYLEHSYSHPILTFLSGTCMVIAIFVHLFSVWIVNFQVNISKMKEGTF
ncbi:hypothetical protein ACRS6Y_07740 [Bacillus cytotoxicus]|uniref:hypothetical protein n=1 Tax=Bacillus cereus group TaxID=86661 RepID=UPI00059FD739|nr:MULTISPECIES: hypothetical protein [Bacillus cereus group]AWC30118.1 hypothetical protein CG483_018355 [Bacillus cytotoxicus]AWC34164.1 hypothetical protein CG482_018310 [Bacillus cytotoxicus]AWC38161.1 hypothetical protein CG481_018160 [Bacillus cytotoxicus]AWC42255.1 hypothetical protein CG480_018355 [Bacillus cytotoxicus]AWC46137.1 hypothetical protein CG479_017515 [Bacillus cytotoxicus]